MLYEADTPRQRSRTQNICFLISISAVILKLMVKIASIFGPYRFLRIAWHDIFSLSDPFRSLSRKLEFVYPPWSSGVRRVIHLSFSSSSTPGRVKGSWNPIPKLTIVLIWKTPTCLKFGKTSNRAVENLPQRKLWVWAANAERSTLSAKNLIPPNFGERVLLRKRQIFALSSSDPINYEVRLLRVSEWLICIFLSLQ